MGQVMGRVMHNATSVLRNYNIEQRAHKEVSKLKPNPAPKYESTKKDLERVRQEFPEAIEESMKKDPELDTRLKQVFVTSSHEIDQNRATNPERPLPMNTKAVDYFELGFKEKKANEIASGKCSLRQAIQFIGDHKLNPHEHTPDKIALEYNMKVEDVKNLLEYYKIFNIHIGKEKQKLLARSNYNTRNFEEYLKLVTKKHESLEKKEEKN